MIFIVVKWPIRPEHSAGWLDTVAEFTTATRAEPGNLFFEWSRSADDPDTYVLLEAFEDDAAGAHVNSAHFAVAMNELGQYLTGRPAIINFQVPGTEWAALGEVSLPAGMD